MGKPKRPTAKDDDYTVVINVVSCIRNKSSDEAAREVAFHREQCERAAAQAATLAVVERLRKAARPRYIDPVEVLCGVVEELDAIEREARGAR